MSTNTKDTFLHGLNIIGVTELICTDNYLAPYTKGYFTTGAIVRHA